MLQRLAAMRAERPALPGTAPAELGGFGEIWRILTSLGDSSVVRCRQTTIGIGETGLGCRSPVDRRRSSFAASCKPNPNLDGPELDKPGRPPFCVATSGYRIRTKDLPRWQRSRFLGGNSPNSGSTPLVYPCQRPSEASWEKSKDVSFLERWALSKHARHGGDAVRCPCEKDRSRHPDPWRESESANASGRYRRPHVPAYRTQERARTRLVQGTWRGARRASRRLRNACATCACAEPKSGGRTGCIRGGGPGCNPGHR